MMRLCLLLLMSLFISACGLMRPAESEHATWEQHQTRLAKLDYWYLQARIAVKTPDDGGTLNLRWTQDAASYEIRVFGAFGKGLAVLRGDMSGASLETAEGDVLQAADAESLFAHQFGWLIPVSELRQWLLGLPGDSTNYSLDTAARLNHLQQGPWTLDISDYRPVENIELPQRLSLTTTELSLRLIVDQWLLHPDNNSQSAPRTPQFTEANAR